MRLRVAGNRVAKEKAKNRRAGQWRKIGAKHENMNGHIHLKDLNGSSYMAMGFYRRVPLNSGRLGILYLADKNL